MGCDLNVTTDIDADDADDSCEKEYVSENLILVMRIISCVIMVVNVVVLVCLVRGRCTFPAVFWYQIVCITCNNVLAGVSSFTMTYVDEPFFGNHLIPCSVMVGFFFTTQCATLYNILAICINRFVVLKQLKRTRTPWRTTHTLLGASIAWLVSAGFCSTPFIIWADSGTYERVRFCSLAAIVGEHVSSTMKILLGSFLIPLVVTDIMYCLMLLVLRREMLGLPAASRKTTSMDSTLMEEVNSRRTSAVTEVMLDDVRIFQSTEVQTMICMAPGGPPIPASLRGRKHSVVNTNGLVIKTEGSIQNADSAEQSVIPIIELTNNEAKAVGATVSTIRRASNDTNAGGPYTLTVGRAENEVNAVEEIDHTTTNGCCCIIGGIESQLGDTHMAENVKHQCQRIPAHVSRLRKAFSLFGLILLALNVFTWPGMIGLLLGSLLDSIHFSRALILPLFSTLTLNSTINPLLYTIRVPEFREAFCNTLPFNC